MRRCYRLKKACQPSVPVRKRIAKKASETRTTQLEEKLDDLVTLLRAQAVAKAHQGSSTSSPHSDSPIAAITSDVLVGASNISSPYASTKGSHPLTNRNTDISTAPSDPDSPLEPLLETDISDADAELNLATFRNTMLKYFPFVYISPMTTSFDLRRQRPFLWFCIMSITTKSIAMHVSMGIRVRKIIAQRVLMDGERSMDLLLGLLCHFGW